MKKNWMPKAILIAAVVTFVVLFFVFDLKSYLTLGYLKSQQNALADFYQQNQLLMISGYLAIYIVSTAMSLPGATILTLAGGGIFGFWLGLVLVSFASTIGATLAFAAARFLLKESIQNKFGDKLKAINNGIEKDGDFYLFSLRLVPIIPFFVINLVMGLTPIKMYRFFFVSQLGMLAGTAVYVNAGTQLSKIESTSDIVSPGLIASFVLLGVFPLVAKKSLAYFKNRSQKSAPSP